MTGSDGGDRRPSSGEASAAVDDDGHADEVVVERLPPDEAFGLLGHETRFRILEALKDADGALAFGDLRERVGVDDPGQFNYHLGKLTGRFVRDGEDGYELAPSGRRVVGAVLSGGYTKALDASPVEVDAQCPLCGTGLQVRFRDHGVNIRCEACDFQYTNTSVPAGVLEGVPADDAPEVVDRWLKKNHATADYGFCHNCDGRMDRTVRHASEADAPDWLDEDGPDATVHYECRRCGHGWFTAVAFAVVLHPAVVGFHHEHGVDVRDVPMWDLDWLDEDVVSVESDDPLRVEVAVTLDGETCVFTFDGDLDVVEERCK